jgi:D-alanine-D-alanine ligase
MNITVVYSMPTRRALASPYADTEQDTVESAAEVARALIAKGAKATLVPVSEDHIERIRDIRADLIFNVIDWTGLDLPLSDRAFAYIEQTGIPFTGATRANYIRTSDKITMKTALVEHRLPTARFQIFERGREVPRKDFRYPVIVKPALEHCSIGLTHDAIVHDGESLTRRVSERIRTFEEPMIAEEFITGREFQVTAVEEEHGLRVLPPAEIVFDKKNKDSMLTFDSRWDDTTADYKSSHVALAVLDPKLLANIETLTTQTFTKIGFRDYTRLDIRVRGGEIVILEANSNPGLSDDMEYGMTLSYKAIGWTFADFIWKIVESAIRRGRRA